MDVSSFAGGFVCNADYLQNIANWSGTTFPEFQTNQRWQFGWAVWYSAKFPSRPTQFTAQDPNFREAFWGFPHASVNTSITTAMVSSLYDRVIASTVTRLATVVQETASLSCDSNYSDTTVFALIGLCVSMACIVIFLIVLTYLRSRKLVSRASKEYGVEDGAEVTNSLMKQESNFI